MRHGRLVRLRLISLSVGPNVWSSSQNFLGASIRAASASKVQQRWSSGAGTSSESSTPPTIPPRQWSTPLAKTIADAIEVEIPKLLHQRDYPSDNTYRLPALSPSQHTCANASLLPTAATTLPPVPCLTAHPIPSARKATSQPPPRSPRSLANW
jgi:hypothetical protein